MVAQFFSIDNQVPRSQCMNFFGWMDGAICVIARMFGFAFSLDDVLRDHFAGSPHTHRVDI